MWRVLTRTVWILHAPSLRSSASYTSQTTPLCLEGSSLQVSRMVIVSCDSKCLRGVSLKSCTPLLKGLPLICMHALSGVCVLVCRSFSQCYNLPSRQYRPGTCSMLCVGSFDRSISVISLHGTHISYRCWCCLMSVGMNSAANDSVTTGTGQGLLPNYSLLPTNATVPPVSPRAGTHLNSNCAVASSPRCCLLQGISSSRLQLE
jgi:hypothetical protein